MLLTPRLINISTVYREKEKKGKNFRRLCKEFERKYFPLLPRHHKQMKKCFSACTNAEQSSLEKDAGTVSEVFCWHNSATLCYGAWEKCFSKVPLPPLHVPPTNSTAAAAGETRRKKRLEKNFFRTAELCFPFFFLLFGSFSSSMCFNSINDSIYVSLSNSLNSLHTFPFGFYVRSSFLYIAWRPPLSLSPYLPLNHTLFSSLLIHRRTAPQPGCGCRAKHFLIMQPNTELHKPFPLVTTEWANDYFWIFV